MIMIKKKTVKAWTCPKYKTEFKEYVSNTLQSNSSTDNNLNNVIVGIITEIQKKYCP